MFTLFCEETSRVEIPKKAGQIGLVFDWEKCRFIDAHKENGIFKLLYKDPTPRYWLSFELYKIIKSLSSDIGFGQLYLCWNRLNRTKQLQCGLIWINELHNIGNMDRPDWLNFFELSQVIDNYVITK